MTGYTDLIRRYAADDRYIGSLDEADGIGEVGLGAEEAGRRLAVRFTLRVEKEAVAAVRFQVFGCGFTIAACAAAAELAEGRPLETALTIDAATVAATLGGLPEERSYCAALAVESLRAAVQSAHSGSAVQTSLQPATEDDHGPRVDADDPIYRALVDSPASPEAAAEDRHLFACLLAVATQESPNLAIALGISDTELTELRATYFPAAALTPSAANHTAPAPMNEEVLELLLSHVPQDNQGNAHPPALWLAKILAARAAHPGHLWVAMGLFERPQLTAAIRRHLPSLAAANHQGMRWKRYLFKEICNRNGGLLCKTPNCGVCSDYALCFATD
ncbi:MAG: nitrogen fixation protein NifQ [Trichloromonadaceae bacterium]